MGIAKSISLCRALTSTYWNRSQLVKKKTVYSMKDLIPKWVFERVESYDLLTPCTNFCVSL